MTKKEDLPPRQKSLNISMATMIQTMPRPSPSNWLVCVLSIKNQESVKVEQHSSLTQNRLAFRKNFHAMVNLTGVSDITRSIEKDSEKSAPALDSFSALKYPGMLLCPINHETLKRLEVVSDSGDIS